MSRANYEIVESTESKLVIRDLGPWDQHLSVTNDVENVVSDLKTELGDRRLFYYDSEGSYDEIVVQSGAFAGFRPGRFAGFRPEVF